MNKRTWNAYSTAILLNVLIHVQRTYAMQYDLLIEDTLQSNYPNQLSDVVIQLNNTLVAYKGSDVTITTRGINSTYVLFRKWSLYKGIDNSFTRNTTSILISCHSCYRLNPASSESLSKCPYLCYCNITSQWTTCHDYIGKINSYNSLVNKLIYPSKQIVVFYDLEREEMIYPVINKQITHLKMVYWDTSYIDCNASDEICKLPLEQHNINTISNFIIFTKLNWKHIIHQKRNFINVLGPENNWLIIDKYKDQVTQDVNDILIPFTHGGNYVTIISDLSKQKGLPELVENFVKDSCMENRTTEKQKMTLLTSNKDVKECVVPNPVESSNVCMKRRPRKTFNLNSIFPIKFHGFYGRTFTVVTKTYSPFVKRLKYENGTMYYSGLVIELLNSLAHGLNFRYSIFEVPDGKFGICENWTNTCEGNRWNGIIGMLQRKEVEIAATGLTIDAKRETVVDFTFPFWEEPSAVLVRRTMDGPALLWVFKPLHLYVWISICAAIFIMAMILWFFARFESYVLTVRDPMYKFVHSLWYTFGAFLQQGIKFGYDKLRAHPLIMKSLTLYRGNSNTWFHWGFYQPKTSAGQMVASGWWLIIVIIYGIYTGNLIAFLAITKVSLPFNTLQQMASQSEYTYGIEDGFIQVLVFKSASTGLYQDIWKGIESNPGSLVPDTETGIWKVKNEKYALISDKTYLQTFSVDDCDLNLIREEFFKVGFGLAVQEGWPYKKYFDEAILKLVEGGFIKRWQQEHFPQDKCGMKLKTVKSKSISVGDMSGNFCTLILGLFLSGLILLAEILVNKVKGIKRYYCSNQTLASADSNSTIIQSISTDNVMFLRSNLEPQILTFSSSRNRFINESNLTFSSRTGIENELDLTSAINDDIQHINIRRNSLISNSSFNIDLNNEDITDITNTDTDVTPKFNINSFLFKPNVPLVHRRSTKIRKNANRQKQEEAGEPIDLNHLTRQSNTVYKTYRPKSPLELL